MVSTWWLEHRQRLTSTVGPGMDDEVVASWALLAKVSQHCDSRHADAMDRVACGAMRSRGRGPSREEFLEQVVMSGWRLHV